MAFPLGNSPTLTGKPIPRTSEGTPNHEATSAAPCKVVLSGESPKTTGSVHDRDPDGSKKGSGSNERSFASGNLVPLITTVLCGFSITHAARLVAQDAHVP